MPFFFASISVKLLLRPPALTLMRREAAIGSSVKSPSSWLEAGAPTDYPLEGSFWAEDLMPTPEPTAVVGLVFFIGLIILEAPAEAVGGLRPDEADEE